MSAFLVNILIGLTTAAEPGFHTEIAPIVHEQCAPCHRPGGPSPFALIDYRDVRKRARQIADVMMEVNFVPETMPLQLMLENFIKHRSNIAVVIDEFGGTAGVISLEDVLEQIFGEIEDEHDIPDLTEKQVGPDEYVLSCRLEVKYLNEKYNLGIEESKEYDTLAGFIIFNYEGIPTAGETVFIGGLQLRILRTTRSRIELARVKKL